MARHNLVKAVKRMKRSADSGRMHLEFKVGDRVFLKMDPIQFRPPRGLSPTLARRFNGPYTMTKRVGKVTYKLQLSNHMRVHDIFHVS